MRLLFAIAHYFNPEGGGHHGSLAPNPQPRIDGLREVVLQLHRLFGPRAGVLNHMERRLDPADDGCQGLEVVILTDGEHHLLDALGDLSAGFSVVVCNPEQPKLLGFGCHSVLAERYQNFDYSCYLEDDIVLRDADFFLKLQCFNRAFGDGYLLQPNRIETSEDLQNLCRFYIDGDYNPPSSAPYRQSMGVELCLEHLGQAVRFRQPLNPHSGCFFLNNAQATRYFGSEASRELDVSFHGPLESAASLGMMKTFQVMKPGWENGRFLSVEHAGRNFMGLLRSS